MSENTPRDSRLCWGSSLSSYSGIDWLTCSSPRNGGETRLWEAASVLLADERRRGYVERPWAHYGLRGIIAGRVVRATSPTHVIVQLSGDRAETDATRLLPLARKASRIDLQTTYRWGLGHAPDVAEACWQVAEATQRNGRPIHTAYVRSTGGGATAYLGSRSSDRFVRVYDKGVESGEAPPGTIWRVELEVKRDVAEWTREQLLQVADVAAAAAELVHAHMSSLGIPLLISTDPSQGFPGHRTEQIPEAASLEWLAVQVRPTVRRLIAAGRRLEVIHALGLTSDTPSDSPSGAQPRNLN